MSIKLIEIGDNLGCLLWCILLVLAYFLCCIPWNSGNDIQNIQRRLDHIERKLETTKP